MQNTELQKIISYTVPVLHTGKDWYVDFYAFDPAANRMRRKKIKLNSIDSIKRRREYAGDLIARLISQLRSGWNPWIESAGGKAYSTFAEVCHTYRLLIDKYLKDGYIRADTHVGYASYLRNLVEYNARLSRPITYIYQFDRAYIAEFLDHIYIERGNKAQTRDNYFAWLRLFSGFLVSRAYAKTKPTDGIESFGNRSRRKERQVIPPPILERISEYLRQANRGYLAACYMIFYCLIRPKELSFIKLEDISLKNKTIQLHAGQTKNKRTATITLPDKVAEALIDAGVLSAPSSWYLFGSGFRPSPERANPKQFRDYWARQLRPALKLPAAFKLYSLKDTGVTMMLLQSIDTLSVRDQARHSSILVTDRYTPHDIARANPIIARFSTCF